MLVKDGNNILVKVEHHDEKGGHHYLGSQGERILSVSEILQHSGIASYDGIPEATLRKAANRGIMVHTACEDVDKKLPNWWADDEELKPRVSAYKNWIKDSGFIVQESEGLLYDP